MYIDMRGMGFNDAEDSKSDKLFSGMLVSSKNTRKVKVQGVA